MSSSRSTVDYYSQARGGGFLTPPPTWRRNRCSPVMPGSERDLFHVIHKVPSGDSPYVRAKHVQLIDKDPTRAISLFWAAINSGDRVDSALKDMAVVMKQLDRSDEAIEAVKSFRNLCPPESQESLDNILVELYKQSGRIEEEIEMLRRKVKQVEEGMAFGGKRTKMARSQGKKIQITVEKEYSRLLGNLAWAYMQHEDFKSAEENYRKALSFELDKNKQCNLAICLMHMNKLTEAKLLLQAIKISSFNGARMDESYAKSFERASETLAELESRCVLNPVKLTDHNKGAFTDFPYEKRSDFGWRKNHMGQGEAYFARKRAHESPFCGINIPKVPFTQPRRSPGSLCGGVKKTERVLVENVHGGYCRKLSFEPSSDSENGQPLVNRNVDQYYAGSNIDGLGKNFLRSGGDWRKKALDSLDTTITKEISTDVNHETRCIKTCEMLTCGHKKSWADMVEEEDEQNWTSDFTCKFGDENVDSNIIISETPKSVNEDEKLRQGIESIDLGEGYFTQPGKNTTLSSVRRSLCFDQNHKSGTLCSEDFSPIKRRNRLQVFQDITSVPSSPKP